MMTRILAGFFGVCGGYGLCHGTWWAWHYHNIKAGLPLLLGGLVLVGLCALILTLERR